ncbi:conserved hypothetical protein [Verticillium alfalfae VaMs.102]|uniref:Uncharacterized protein n=4 Tax=Verticillium TaxID=1036719 RepID=C9SHG5_VERA1|nr:conserved hypothetical protein [Verticillium alfalfae VaMs.102]EEY18388.1 conserved hypothetical protein [Verticillium alfalfae VaMs.102]
MRRRQSMQVLELESRLEQLTAENRMLAEANANAGHNTTRSANPAALAERDAQIDQLKQSLDFLQKEVARLTEVNDGLNSANSQLASQHNETSRALETSRTAYDNYGDSLHQKDAEIERLRAELEAAKEQVREMQRQILATKGATGG